METSPIILTILIGLGFNSDTLFPSWNILIYIIYIS
jgi:hypothetical protein